MRMFLRSWNRSPHLGLLVLRVLMGIMFMLHGGPKLLGGPELWEKVGGAMGTVGIHFAPTLWGLMAALSEFVGGLFLVLGLFTRTSCFFLLMTMIVAATMHLANGDGFSTASHAIEAGIVFLSLIWIGPGRLSLDAKLEPLNFV